MDRLFAKRIGEDQKRTELPASMPYRQWVEEREPHWEWAWDTLPDYIKSLREAQEILGDLYNYLSMVALTPIGCSPDRAMVGELARRIAKYFELPDEEVGRLPRASALNWHGIGGQQH